VRLPQQHSAPGSRQQLRAACPPCWWCAMHGHIRAPSMPCATLPRRAGAQHAPASTASVRGTRPPAARALAMWGPGTL
jgi:hypothetical protein